MSLLLLFEESTSTKTSNISWDIDAYKSDTIQWDILEKVNSLKYIIGSLSEGLNLIILSGIGISSLYSLKLKISLIRYYNMKTSLILIKQVNILNTLLDFRIILKNIGNKLGFDPILLNYDLLTRLGYDLKLTLLYSINSIDSERLKTIQLINYLGSRILINKTLLNALLDVNIIDKITRIITTIGKLQPLHLGDFEGVADKGASAPTGDYDIFLDTSSIKDVVEDISITLSENYFTNSFEATISDITFWGLLEPDGSTDLRIRIKIGIDNYYFLLEKRELTASFGKRQIKIWGRSKTATLGEPYSTKLDTQYASSGMASDVIASLATSFTLEYEAFDYFIPENTLEISGKTPIQVIDEIAKAGGGIVRSGKQGELIIRYKRPYNPDTIEAEITNYDFDYYDHILSLGESEVQESGYNAVLVETDTSSLEGSNVSGTIVLDPERTPDNPTQDDPIYIRVYLIAIPDHTDPNYPYSFYELRTTDGSLNYQGTITEEVTEQVNIIASKGSTEYPILNISSYSWIGLNPGTIDADPERENTLVLTPSGDRTEGILSITYNTVYDLWYADSLDENAVLFVAAKEI